MKLVKLYLELLVKHHQNLFLYYKQAFYRPILCYQAFFFHVFFSFPLLSPLLMGLLSIGLAPMGLTPIDFPLIGPLIIISPLIISTLLVGFGPSPASSGLLPFLFSPISIHSSDGLISEQNPSFISFIRSFLINLSLFPTPPPRIRA